MILKGVPLLILVSVITVSYTSAATDKVVCFFASWAGYRNGRGSFKPENIDPDLCTHVLYAFLGVNPDGTLEILDSWNEVDLGGLSKVSSLKESNSNLKTLISIGGWNAGHPLLGGIIASRTLRKNLIDSCLSFFDEWGYDGIDIDWEFPTAGDKANFVLLLQEMKAAFEPQGYILSVTVYYSPTSSYGYDVPAINKVADLINLMSYDFHTADQPTTGLNSPLYGDQYSVNVSVSSWLKAGADAEKITFSVPFYGRAFSLTNPKNHGIGASATTGTSGPYTQEPGLLGYNEICEFYNDWERVWVEEAQVPYIYSGSNWASYEDEESLASKAQYAKAQGLAGITVWSIDTDDFLGSCGTDHPLLRAIKNSF